MNILQFPLLLTSIVFVSVLPQVALATPTIEKVIATENGKAFEGTLYLPEKATAKNPVSLVIVVPEWWGKNEFVETRAKRVAEEWGYAALAVDVYGGNQIVDNPTDAQALATPFYQDGTLAAKRISALLTAISGNTKINFSRVASIGFCFGGTQSLNLARLGSESGIPNLKAVVSFHGGLKATVVAKGKIETRILVLHGAADPFVPEAEVNEFKKEMKTAKTKLNFHAYPGAVHAFTNPKSDETGKKFQIPVKYDAKADADSWNRAKKWLRDSI